MNFKIYVAYHREAELISTDVYTPIHVGKAISSIKLPGIITDDTKDNISYKNGIYCELTATYWAWKNSDADYIGLCHYRRFFTFERPPLAKRIKAWRKLEKRILLAAFSTRRRNEHYANLRQLKTKSSDEIKKYTSDFITEAKELMTKEGVDIIAATAAKINHSIRVYWSVVIGAYHVHLMQEIVNSLFPQYNNTLEKLYMGNEIHPANMVVMKKNKFDEYANFLFTVLAKHEELCVERGWCKDPFSEGCMSRVSGYLAELLTSIFVTYEKENSPSKVRFANIVHFDS